VGYLNKKILYADDEARMRRLISDFLKKEGFDVIEASNGEKALEIYNLQQDIALVILDVMMPILDGWTVCKEIRKNFSVPIIMLTARTEEADEIYGFDIGADEYITKPFSAMVLVARVKALLRRTEGRKKGIQAYGGISIDEVGHEVYVDGNIITLSPKEFEFLVYLVKNDGIALSREKILDAVWDFDYYGDVRTVDTHIRKLRAKLGSCSEYIQTVRGHGYKFEAGA